MYMFVSALDENPDDWDLRLIYADYLEDNNDPMLANAQRWMATNKRRPFNNPHKKTWIWMNQRSTDFPSSLPDNILIKLQNSKKKISSIKWFSSREEAERSLANALQE